MFPIVQAEWLAPDIRRLVVVAPRVAKKRQAGQFVILRVYPEGERIPLTICDSDPHAGTITLIVQGVGKTTKLLNALEAGDQILDVVGPLGNPSEIKRFGQVVVIAGGVGAAIALPTAHALKSAGNHVTAILGGRTRELVVLERELAAASHELIITTDDGSYGRAGRVVDPLHEWIEQQRRIDLVLAIGPIRMMQAVAEATRSAQIHTVVSLNSLMVDGTGMCGGCRVLTRRGARFACVDGPEFDAHEVDFEVLAQRSRAYAERERVELQQFLADPQSCVEHAREGCRLEQRHPEVRTSTDAPHDPEGAAP
ncbi:MAG: sulfide/dihydroorotate dehydrogenase-like FAD/NAD-binding protein [Pirellulales bacterium]